MSVKSKKELDKLIRNDFDKFIELLFDHLPKDQEPQELSIEDVDGRLYLDCLENYFNEKINFDFYYEDIDETVEIECAKLRRVIVSRDLVLSQYGYLLHELIVQKSFFKIGIEFYEIFFNGLSYTVIQKEDHYKKLCWIYALTGYAFYFLDDLRAVNFLKKAVIGIDDFERVEPYFYIISMCYNKGIGVIQSYKKSYSYVLISNSLTSGNIYQDEIDEFEKKLSSKDVVICQENAEVLLDNYKNERKDIEFTFL